MKKKLTAAILAGLTLATMTPAFAATDAEVNDLQLRVAALEKSKQSAQKITITGESRIRFQTDDNDTAAIDGTSAFDLRQRLYLNAKVNDHVSYTSRLEATFQNGDNSKGTTRFNQNYFTVTNFGLDKMLIGRVPAAAGMNLNVGKPSDNDGIILVQKEGDVTFTGFVLEEVTADTQFNGIYAGMSLNKDTDVAIGYTQGDAVGGIEAKSFDIGAYTKLGDDFSLVGEFVDTNNTGADDANAWAVQVVKGVTTKKVGTLSTNMTIVDKSKPHTQGYMLSYRRVEDNGLWANGVASPFNANNSAVSSPDNTKGIYLGYQNVLAKDTILTLEYQDLDNTTTGDDKDKIFQTHVQFYF